MRWTETTSPVTRLLASVALPCALIAIGCGGQPATGPQTPSGGQPEPARPVETTPDNDLEKRLQPGDLLAQDLDCGPMCDAIESVTQGVDGARLSHIAMVTESWPDVRVIEAYAKGVVEIALDELLARSRDAQGRPKVLVLRLKPPWQHLVPKAIEAARAKLGKPYDEAFLIDNGAYYCSELLYEAFYEANGKRELFRLEPMTYKAAGTQEIAPVWRAHFEKRQEPVPEALPGLNPGGMSRAPVVDVIGAFGHVEGYRGNGG